MQEYPEPLVDRCAAVINSVTPTAHQYASIAFMLTVCSPSPCRGTNPSACKRIFRSRWVQAGEGMLPLFSQQSWPNMRVISSQQR